jgi:hypothetical protein
MSAIHSSLDSAFSFNMKTVTLLNECTARGETQEKTVMHLSLPFAKKIIPVLDTKHSKGLEARNTLAVTQLHPVKSSFLSYCSMKGYIINSPCFEAWLRRKSSMEKE